MGTQSRLAIQLRPNNTPEFIIGSCVRKRTVSPVCTCHTHETAVSQDIRYSRETRWPMVIHWTSGANFVCPNSSHRFPPLASFSIKPHAIRNRCWSNRGLYSLNSRRNASAVWTARTYLVTYSNPSGCSVIHDGGSIVQSPTRILLTISAARMKCILLITFSFPLLGRCLC